MIDFKHLSTVGESYTQHLQWCLYSVYIYIIMIPIALIHGLFPFLLAKSIGTKSNNAMLIILNEVKKATCRFPIKKDFL